MANGWTPGDLFGAPQGSSGDGCADATQADPQGCVSALPQDGVPSVFGEVFDNFWSQLYDQVLPNWPTILGFFALWFALAVVVWVFRWFRKRGDSPDVVV